MKRLAMKRLAGLGYLLSTITFGAYAMAEDQPGNAIPTVEKEFVNAINKYSKSQIIEQFGEPASADDVKIKGSDKVVASIWHYHFINTTPDGVYYETTELDFIDDKVVMVVFLNNDGSEGIENGKKYEMPDGKPAL